VEVETVRAVVARHLQTGAPVVTARYGDATAPPTVYHRSLFRELVGGEGEGRGRQVVRRHWDQAELVPVPPSELADVDAWDDYDRARQRVEGEERR